MAQEEDKCPRCEEGNLNQYSDGGEVEIDDDHEKVYTYYECRKCKFEGRQVYNLEFEEHQTEDGEEIPQ